MSPRVVLFDYGSGNIRSGQRALTLAGAAVQVTADAEATSAADGVVVPGVGAYGACMESLRAVNGHQLIPERLAAGRPVLGICVGHQVMFERGDEHGVSTPGLGLWAGAVCEVEASVLPHIGWNTVEVDGSSRMFDGVGDARFYFVHSYAAHDVGHGTEPGRGDLVTTWTTHEADRFVAAVEDGPLWSTQFHPEKSGSAGIALLRNWLATL